jgi:hypothetical protein
MKCFRIKHVPTELYFIHSKVGKGNLSMKGKIYTKKPSLAQLPYSIRITFYMPRITKKAIILCNYFKIPIYNGFDRVLYDVDRYFKVPKTDWQIEEIE